MVVVEVFQEVVEVEVVVVIVVVVVAVAIVVVSMAHMLYVTMYLLRKRYIFILYV